MKVCNFNFCLISVSKNTHLGKILLNSLFNSFFCHFYMCFKCLNFKILYLSSVTIQLNQSKEKNWFQFRLA